MDPNARFSAAVLDVNLSGLSGGMVFNRMHESETEALRQLPVVFFTGHPDCISDEILSAYGLSVVLDKPHSLSGLCAAIETIPIAA